MKSFCQIFFIFLLILCNLYCKNIGKQTLGSDYYLIGEKENPASIKIVHGTHTGFDDVILGEIIDSRANNEIIVVHRKITDKAKAIFEDNALWQKQLKGTLTDQYWIIEKNSDAITGPLNYQEYLAKRKQLNISEGINVAQ